MGIVASFMDRRIAAELDRRGVLVWYDRARAWQPWVLATHGENSPGHVAVAAQVTIAGRDAQLVVSTGSHYETLEACEPLVSGSESSPLLVYIPGEPYLEMLSPLRELECLGGEKEPYQPELTQIARQALQSAGLSESKIDELLNRDGLDFAYLDSISIGDGGESPLAPVFGSSREMDVLPSFLSERELRTEAADKGLLPEVARLASQGLGLQLSPETGADAMAQELARALLVAEMRSDLDGPEPVAISQIAAPTSDEQLERVRAVCHKLRREHPEVYEGLADTVEQALGLAQAEIDAETLGRIDTFRFEEQALLEACDRWLAEGDAKRALAIVDGRLAPGQGKQVSFWTSVSRYPDRHAAWEAGGELARLALSVQRVDEELKRPPADATGWVEAYARSDGWHAMDQSFRTARYRLSRLEARSTLERGATRVFEDYDALLERMATGFVEKLRVAGWQVPGVLRQEQVYDHCVARRTEPVAYILADAMRFEMGAELVNLVEAIGAKAVQLEPAVAVAPSITDLGMAALMPGAEQSFSIAETPRGITGTIGGRPLVGSAARMEHAKGQVPGLVEMTLDRLVHELSPKKRDELLKDAKVVIIRSQEIDGIGENLPAGVTQKIMGTILEDLRGAVQRLADAGIHQFVIVADHGHLFGESRGDDMKIDPPEAGRKVDLHRRCWVGRGGSTPSSCVRLSSSDLGYEGTDLELVVPKGTGVFKAGGSLAFHHGGLSLQELIVPVLRFELRSTVASDSAGKKGGEAVAIDAPKQINNLIFSVNLNYQEMFPARVRVLAVNSADGKVVGQAAFATAGWDAEDHVLTLTAGDPVSVGLQIDDEAVQELRVIVTEVETQKTLKDTSPIPVSLTVR